MELVINNVELSELISDIYQGALTGDWQPSLHKIMEYTESNKAFFILSKIGDDSPIVLELTTNFDFPEQALIGYKENPIEDDPCFQTTKLLTEGEYHYCNEVIDLQQHKHTKYFQEVFVPMRAYHVLVGILCRDGAHESVFSVNRDEGEPEYGNKDKNLFNLITPHFSRAMHIFKELRLYKQYSNISKSIIDQQDKGILVCTQDGTVVIKNNFAEQCFDASVDIYLSDNRIKIRDKVAQKRFEQYVDQCASLSYQEIGTQETLIIEQSQSINVLITISPLLNQNTFNDLEQPCCLITMTLEHQVNWQSVKSEFELTPKELKLIKAIYGKKKLNELSEEFSVSYNTLRTHLQNIFRKAEVNSQTELMIKLNMF